MTYAGYQRYEVPDLGDIASKAIQQKDVMDLKRKELELKEKELAEKLQSEKDALAAKGNERAEKRQEGIDKNIDIKEKELYGATTEAGKATTSADINGMMGDYANLYIKPGYNDLKKQYNDGLITEQEFNTRSNELTYGTKDLGQIWTNFDAVAQKMNTNANTNPFEKWAVNSLYNDVAPSTSSKKRLVKESNGPTYVEDDNGNKVDVGILKNVTGIVQHPVINFDEDAKKNVIELIPKNSTETLRKGGGTQTDIDQTKNDNFEKFSNIWINKVTADEYAAANAYSHYMNDGNVAFIKKGASKDERKKAVLALGVDEDKWEENQKYLVEVEIDDKSKVPMPILTKEQKAELKKEMKSNVTAMAVKSKAISTPSTTTVNITSQAQAQSQADDLVQGVRNNEAGWVDTFKTLARRAGRIIPTGTIKDANGVDHDVVSYNPTTKIMTVYSEQGKSGTTVSWQPEYIDMNNEKQARTKIASLIKASEVTSNTAATLPPITR